MGTEMNRSSLLAIDIGGTGSRIVAVDAMTGDTVTADGPSVAVGPSGIRTAELVGELLEHERIAHVLRTPPAAVAVGMSGVLSLGGGVEHLARSLKRRWPETAVVAASDAVTALVGALGLEGGVVVSAGTGAVALGSDLAGIWQRVDGWGHVLGDDGSGAWIGMHGLRNALRQHDGRAPGGALILAARDAFGDLESLPARIYTREDRAGVLASFAPKVLAAAEDGDAAAVAIAARAGSALAETALAALVPGLPRRVALTGGLAEAGGVLIERFRGTLSDADVDAVHIGSGASVEGAMIFARQAAEHGSGAHHPPFIARLA